MVDSSSETLVVIDDDVLDAIRAALNTPNTTPASAVAGTPKPEAPADLANVSESIDAVVGIQQQVSAVSGVVSDLQTALAASNERILVLEALIASMITENTPELAQL